MRITQNAQALSYNRSILELQERVDRGQNKITTGLNYSNLSEQPITNIGGQKFTIYYLFG
jgi:flagellin-like hook-associated protein FlgL